MEALNGVAPLLQGLGRPPAQVPDQGEVGQAPPDAEYRQGQAERAVGERHGWTREGFPACRCGLPMAGDRHLLEYSKRRRAGAAAE